MVLDAVVNHTGPVTEIDKVYPNSWVRSSPTCTYNNFKNTTECTLVANLPDVLTESNLPAELPQMLVDKWKKEGRYEAEIKSLNDFFKRTGYPKAPKYYIMKWLADYVEEFGIDGYRVDTVKHNNEEIFKKFVRNPLIFIKKTTLQKFSIKICFLPLEKFMATGFHKNKIMTSEIKK